MGTGEVFATLGLDLTRRRCNCHPVEGSNRRVGGFSGHLEDSEAPRLISRPDPALQGSQGLSSLDAVRTVHGNPEPTWF